MDVLGFVFPTDKATPCSSLLDNDIAANPIIIKLLMLFKVLNNFAPSYICTEMREKKTKSSCSLCSKEKNLLVASQSHSAKYGDRTLEMQHLYCGINHFYRREKL